MALLCVSVRAVRAVHSVWHVCVGGMCVQVYEDAGWLSVAGGVEVKDGERATVIFHNM